jgi:hypothetical protein
MIILYLATLLPSLASPYVFANIDYTVVAAAVPTHSRRRKKKEK